MLYWTSPDASNSRIVKGELNSNTGGSCTNLRTGISQAQTIEINALGMFAISVLIGSERGRQREERREREREREREIC